jgi:hypothetical protein
MNEIMSKEELKELQKYVVETNRKGLYSDRISAKMLNPIFTALVLYDKMDGLIDAIAEAVEKEEQKLLISRNVWTGKLRGKYEGVRCSIEIIRSFKEEHGNKDKD